MSAVRNEATRLPQNPQPRGDPMATMAADMTGAVVADAMTGAPLTLPTDLTTETASWWLLDRGISGTPVTDQDDRLVGYVAMTDLVRAQQEPPEAEESRAQERAERERLLDGFSLTEPSVTTVGEIMSRPTVAFLPAMPLLRAVAMMSFEGLQRVPVVDTDRRVVGVLSAIDVLRWIARRAGYSVPSYTQVQLGHRPPSPRH